MSKKSKYYVVWQGHNPGVYDNWNDCAEQVKGFSNARYKAFDTAEAAQQAFREAPEQHITSRATSEEKASQAALRKANTSLAALSPHSPKERPILMPSPDVLEKVGFSTVVVECSLRQNRSYGISRHLFRHRTRDFPLWSCLGHEQHWRISCHCSRSRADRETRTQRHHHL